jgi:hypothetical protein
LLLIRYLATPTSAAAAPTRPGPAVATWAAAACSGPLRLRPSLIYHEISIPEQPTVQHLDRFGGLFFRGHLDEPESARPSRELVRDDTNRLHGPGLLKELAKVLLGSLEGEVPYEQLCGHRATS